MQHIQENPSAQLTIDLENQVLTTPVGNSNFEINSYKKICLTNGYDDIDFLISKKELITQFELDNKQIKTVVLLKLKKN